jgi:hypothetical protein
MRERDRDAAPERALVVVCAEVDEHWPHPLAARGDGAPTDRRDEPGVPSDGCLESALELVEIRFGDREEPGLGAHRATSVVP